MKILKNNQVIIYAIALMLVAAGYLNYTSKDNKLIPTSSDAGVINTNELADIGDAILNNTNSSETQKSTATKEIENINQTKNSIMICENLIETKGFKNSVIFVNGESISVIVEAEELTQDKIAQIQNIISRELNADISNVHITNK